MPFSSRRVRRPLQKQSSLRLLAAVLIAAMSVPAPQVLAEAAGEQARNAVDAAITFFAKRTKKKALTISSQGFRSPSERAMDVKYLRLCPRKLLLYVGEDFTLVPLPLDQDRNAVHGAALTFATGSPGSATVSSSGGVLAIAAGHTQVTVTAGNIKANVDVEVRAGILARVSTSGLQQLRDVPPHLDPKQYDGKRRVCH